MSIRSPMEISKILSMLLASHISSAFGVETPNSELSNQGLIDKKGGDGAGPETGSRLIYPDSSISAKEEAAIFKMDPVIYSRAEEEAIKGTNEPIPAARDSISKAFFPRDDGAV